MKVYVVSEVCDDEYLCTEVLFVTADEEIAKQYCATYNRKNTCWDGREYDEITYQEYDLETSIPTRR